MYTLTLLENFGQACFYQLFTFPSFRKYLTNLQSDDSIVAIGAIDNQPVGLLVAKVFPEEQIAEVNSIFVVESHRRQGIGRALLVCLEQELIVRGCRVAQLVYITDKPVTIALDNFLQKCNWSPSQPRQLVCKFGSEILQAPCYRKNYNLPSSFSIFSWPEITAKERIQLQNQQKINSWIPLELHPFQYEENLEGLNSLGMRYQGEVVGWVLTHRLADDTIRYTCSFIRPDLQRRGRIIPLYQEAIKRQFTVIQEPKAIWTVPFIFPQMVNFVKKYLAPYAMYLRESRIAHKLLVESSNQVAVTFQGGNERMRVASDLIG